MLIFNFRTLGSCSSNFVNRFLTLSARRSIADARTHFTYRSPPSHTCKASQCFAADFQQIPWTTPGFICKTRHLENLSTTWIKRTGCPRHLLHSSCDELFPASLIYGTVPEMNLPQTKKRERHICQYPPKYCLMLVWKRQWPRSK